MAASREPSDDTPRELGTPLSNVEFQIVSRTFYSGSNGANSAMTQPRGDPTA